MVVNSYYKVFLKKIGLAFGLYILLRLIFVLFNWQYFQSVKISYFIFGLRFDWVAVSYLFFPFSLFYFIPLPQKIKLSEKYLQWLNFWYLIGIVFSALANLTDVVYFRFTLKRTTSDVFKLFSNSTETWDLLPMFLLNYWYLLLIFVLIIFAFVKLIKHLDKDLQEIKNLSIVSQSIGFVIVSIFLVVGFRGGFQHKPITIINAGEYATGADVNIVLNTPFTLLKTLLEEQLTVHYYFDDEKELKKYFNPIKTISSQNQSLNNKNVVLIILESFGKEYISYFNENHHLTPFLDSLLRKSAVYNYSYANGRKSIEALPAIFSSIPALINTPFIVSNYAGNNIESLPLKLKDIGYSTHFFHGGKNGTMSFDAFCYAAGIQHYYGLNEYPAKEIDFDGNWGIYDEPYLQYVASCLDTVSNPFFAGVFTLSSHHPFKVPEKYKSKFTQLYNELEISPTISYTDFALSRFFNAIKSKAWFKNTLFVITADHTSLSKDKFYKNRLGVYNVPIAFYSPDVNLKQVIDTAKIIQHIDLYPTILSLMGINDTVFSFGDDILKRKTIGVNYLNGIYQFIIEENLIRFDGEKIIDCYRYKNDSLLKNNILKQLPEDTIIKYTKTAQAIIQTYDESLLNNKMTVSEP
jgi:hypothetical protein